VPVEALPANKFGLRIQVKQSGRMKPPNLEDKQLKLIGDRMVAAQLARWKKGYNSNGVKGKRLSLKYAAEKRAFTRNQFPIRDMKMTGRTIQNFTLRKAARGIIRAENTTRLERAKAMRAQKADDMIGFAPSDFIVVYRSMMDAYGQWASKAWIPVRKGGG
jgi:hypothetical protein